MSRRSPPPTDGEHPHFLLGSIVRNGFSSRRNGDPVPLAPSVVRTAMHRRRPWIRPMVALAGAGLVALAVIGVARSSLMAGPTLRYVVERQAGAGEKKLRFTDGSTISAENSTRLRVVAAGRRGARLRLEEGSAHLRIAGRPRAEWLVEAGPYTLTVGGGELEVSWTAGQTRLSVVQLSGMSTIHGPFPQREGLRIRTGENLVARATDGFWRVGRGRHEAVASGEVPGNLSLGAAPAGLPSRLGPGPTELITSTLVTDGRCNRNGEPAVASPRHDEAGTDPWTWVDRSTATATACPTSRTPATGAAACRCPSWPVTAAASCCRPARAATTPPPCRPRSTPSVRARPTPTASVALSSCRAAPSPCAGRCA
jgi:hypothetical protein